MKAAGYFVTKDGTVHAARQYGWADDGSYCNETDIFADLDGDGNRTRRIAAAHSMQCEILYSPLVSGTYLSVSDPVTKLSGSNVTVQAEGDYVYRMTYSQMVNRSKDVVLFDILEDLDGNTWSGSLKAIDTSDADRQNLDYVIYINRNKLDAQAYVDAKATERDLIDGADGWTVWNGLDDLSGVTAVAVSFGSQEFTKDEAGKPSMVSIRLTMAAPAADSLNKSINTVQNRSFYSDVLMDNSNQARTVMSNVVTVEIDPEQLAELTSGFALPDTGGTGTTGYYVAGVTVLCAGAVLLAIRRRKRA